MCLILISCCSLLPVYLVPLIDHSAAILTVNGSAENETAGQATVSVTLSALNPPSAGLDKQITVTLSTTGEGTATGK